MQDSTSRSKSRVTIAGRSQPPDGEQARALLQERLAVFGKVVFVLVFVSLVLGAVLALSSPSSGWRKDWSGLQQYHVLASALPGGLWLLCRRGVLGVRVLHFVDAAAVILICTLFALVGATSSSPRPLLFTILLAVSHIIVARAVVVPSSARRTLIVSGLAMTPVFIAVIVMVSTIADVTFSDGAIQVAAALAWGVVAVSIASMSSRVIFGLRNDMRQAKRLGQYTLLDPIGKGGMGVVYKAQHALIRRPTAIKLLSSDKTGEENLKRIEREVRLTSTLTHPNTITIYDYGRASDGQFYYAMEHVDGLSLQELVDKHGPLSPGRVIHIMRQVCAALTEAHGVGLIHRDIKPTNILLCKRGGVFDVVKVLDFGLVKEVEGTSLGGADTQAKAVAGAPLYLPPEAVNKPNEVDARSDLYALGCVGFYLITGQPVFAGANLVEICSHHLHTPAPRPSERLGATVPADLEAVLLGCLEKDPRKRPQDAAALRAKLAASAAAKAWTEKDAGDWWRSNKPAGDAPVKSTKPKPSAGDAPAKPSQPKPATNTAPSKSEPAAGDAPAKPSHKSAADTARQRKPPA